ncbi:transposase [Filibacter limicola]|uniref:Transposase n=2 Tax=Sporosarcina limicola TaxID=34101 RepID=A0A927R4L0_9BACL|nr:transposase [Sporosarcina limicola]
MKKRRSYGTIMVDLADGRVIDLIESREKEDVVTWLSLFPNIKYVSRDGSLTYAAAIREAHPEAHHISDRFHLVKNLTDAITLCMYRVLPGRIVIPLTNEQNAMNELLTSNPSRRTKILWVKSLASQGRTIQDIRLQTKCSPQTIRKYIRMQEEDIPKDSDDQRGREHKEAIQNITDKAKEVKSLQEKGYSIRKIADETGYTKKTIKNYLSPDFNPIHGQYGVQRPGKLSPFRNEVIALRSKGTTYKEIYTSICKKGYTGSEAAIRQFIAKEKRLQGDLEDDVTAGSTEIVERKWLVKLLYKPLNNVKAISQEQVKNVVEKYPLFGTLLRLVWRFKEILQSGEKELLHTWISEAAALELNELTSFLNGIKKDIDAVENACTPPYNNGLTEGSVNKLKTIKRIMYGRNSFELLRNKLLLLESRKFN